MPVPAGTGSADFIAVCFDMLANEIAKSRYMTDGQVSFPLVVRTANAGGARFGAQHSQSVENWCMMIPCLKVVAPSTPEDVVGLMAASIRDPDAVVIFEHKSLMANKPDVREGEMVEKLCGWGAEVVSIVGEDVFWDLDGPCVRITTPHIPLSAAASLEDLALPSVDRIYQTVLKSVHAGMPA